MPPLQVDVATLSELFEMLPISLPEAPLDSKLPPRLDFDFASEEGAWPAFNKAMHAAFGDKSKGLKIRERGKALAETISLIHWCLKELETKEQMQSVELVLMWVTSLSEAARAAGAKITDTLTRSRRAPKPSRQLLLREAAANANTKAKVAQASRSLKKKYKYVSNDGSEHSTDPEDDGPIEKGPAIVISEDEEYCEDPLIFSASDSCSDSSEEYIGNNEVADILMRKTGPGNKKLREAAQHANEVIEDSLPKRCKRKKCTSKKDASKSTVMGISGEPPKKRLVGTHLKVPNNEYGQAGADGDKHYRCCHGKNKTLTITRRMKGNQNGLIGHLRTHFPIMNHLYEELKSRKDSPPTVLELQIASGQIPLNSEDSIEYIKSLEAKRDRSLVDMFKEQAAKKESPFDPKEFEKRLTEWLVACDQPFEEVERPEKDASLLNALEKLRHIVRAIRSSPQRRKLWKQEVEALRRDDEGHLEEVVKMLILDVRTRWASTHQMCRRALDYRKEITSYVAKMIPLRRYELSDNDWEAIELITRWLKTFHAATTQMSATKRATLSSTHAVFKGLQDSIRQFLREIPETASPGIRKALLASHCKLSDYFHKFDQSPYPIWASLLDPRIGYKGLVDDHTEEPDLLAYVDARKQELELYYQEKYAGKAVPPLPTASPFPSASRAPASPEKVNFTARYSQRQPLCPRNELEDFFRMTPELWESCDPVQWWGARKLQFPNLSRLARDLLSIPGSAVAVERIFSGGRDTISLRRASLKPETIRTLMLVKQRLRLARSHSSKV
ncbi:hypothetical protein M422DRAFT_271550 [Sphaerobolus stellatus SS14]|uniref:Unplaced genomic scaffold SPHSTscaffold_265, whole genome shotgun sequence n=1 Tax=Sphaerobolus stellatus (strain SS14) TaxID=990650 RepID=A0A0C9UPC3_SPHS4|nr:hypothetical protein M422DRAFT_271550 [Sphaerobolus stellatus SS14]